MDERLSEAGYKVTGPRRKIIAALQAAVRPLTAQEVAALAGTSVASTYRALALLAELGVIGETPDHCDTGDADAADTAGSADMGQVIHSHAHHDNYASHPVESNTMGNTVGSDVRGRRYILCSTSGHHHHFSCRSCHALIEVTCDALERALAELERESGLAVEHHEVTLSGLCAACRVAGAVRHAPEASTLPGAQQRPLEPMTQVAVKRQEVTA
ncbi:MAG: Fur family transcriptional regulator [Ktedonobacterales bacterium]